MVVVAMKSDLVDKRVIPAEELQRLQQREPAIKVLEASAKTGDGVNDAFTVSLCAFVYFMCIGPH